MSKDRAKKGHALIIVIFASLLIIILAAIMATSLHNELRIKINQQDRTKLKYITQGGIEDGIFYLDKAINEMLFENKINYINLTPIERLNFLGTDIDFQYQELNTLYDNGKATTKFYDQEGQLISSIKYDDQNTSKQYTIETEGILYKKNGKHAVYCISATIKYDLDYMNWKINGYEIIDYKRIEK